MQIIDIFRYPVKGLGPERLEATELATGRVLPGDRAMAIAHGRSEFDAGAPAWQPRRNFQVVANSPALARVALSQKAGLTEFNHPTSAPITVDLSTVAGSDALATWVGELPGAAPGPFAVAHVEGQAMTDMKPPFISIHSTASLDALSKHLGVKPNPHRFRGNIWIADAEAWAEESWIGKTITFGAVRLRVMEPVGRCRAPEANPETGQRDAEVTAALHKMRGTTNFGVYAEVITPGTIKTGDPVTVQ